MLNTKAQAKNHHICVNFAEKGTNIIVSDELIKNHAKILKDLSGSKENFEDKLKIYKYDPLKYDRNFISIRNKILGI